LSAPADTTRWGTVLLLVGIGVVAAIQMGKVAAALPEIRAELALGLVGAGWLASVFSLIGASLGILAGAAADRAGHRPALIAALAALGTGSAIGALAGDTTALFASRILEGLGFVAIITSVPALCVRAAAARDGRLVLGVWTVYLPIGLAGIMVAAPPLLAAGGWRAIWAGNAALAAGALVAALIATRALADPPRSAAASSPVAAIRATLARPGTVLSTVPFCCYSMSFIAVISFLPTFLIEDRGASPAEAGLLVAAAILCNGIGNLAAGWMMRRALMPWAVMTIGCAGMAVVSLGIFEPGLDGALRQALAMAFPFFGGLVAPAAIANAARHAPAPALVGTAIGVAIQGTSVGHFLGPPVLAMVVSAFGGWDRAAVFTGLLGLCGVVAALVLRRIERRMTA